MLTVEIGGRRKFIPSSYNEVTLKQLRIYIEFVERRKSEIFGLEDGKVVVANAQVLTEAQTALLWSILDIKFHLFSKISSTQLRDLIATEKLVEFFFSDLLTTNKVPRIKSLRGSLYGPVNAFHRLTYEEFGFADTAYDNFNATREIKHLDELIAILYRPAKKNYNPKAPNTDGDIRQEFNFHTVDFRLARVAKMREVDKWCIYLWFDHCRRQLVENYQELFDQKSSKKSGERSTWVDTAMAIARGVINFPTIRKTGVYIIFQDLKRIDRERKDMEEQIEAAKNKRK